MATKIISLNANGIRAAAGKGFFDWLPKQNADVVCIQETRAQIDQLMPEPRYFPKPYCHYYVGAEKKGYSGVAIYAKKKPARVIRKREYIICGDWNIAHKEIDLKNWRGNKNNSGFLPAERAWLDNLFYKEKYIDVFRTLNRQENQYTWWSNRGQAWAKNVGWRIDYQIATPGLANCALGEAIYKDQRFSDHAPLIIEYQLKL